MILVWSFLKQTCYNEALILEHDNLALMRMGWCFFLHWYVGTNLEAWEKGWWSAIWIKEKLRRNWEQVSTISVGHSNDANEALFSWEWVSCPRTWGVLDVVHLQRDYLAYTQGNTVFNQLRRHIGYGTQNRNKNTILTYLTITSSITKWDKYKEQDITKGFQLN